MANQLTIIQQIQRIGVGTFHQLTERTRFAIFSTIHLLLVLATFLYGFFYSRVHRPSIFYELTENAIFPILIPVTALFFGGSILAEEIDSKQLVFDLHRPVARSSIVLGKWSAATITGISLVVFSILSLLVISFGPTGWSIANAKMLLAGGLGTATYAAIFAALTLWFESSMTPAIIYFALIEVTFYRVPILELISIRYHLYNTAKLSSVSQTTLLDRMVLEESLTISWPISFGFLMMATVFWLGATILIFRSKEFDF